MSPSPAVRKARWQMLSRLHTPEHPAARAAFGRYVAARGGTLTAVSAGPEAWVGWLRQNQPGANNRSLRRWARANWVANSTPVPEPFS